MKKFVLLGLMALGACAESSSVSIERSKKYLNFVQAVQSAQEKLNAFVAAEQKKCEVNKETLQMGGNGVLSCVVPAPVPQVNATSVPSAASKK